MKGFEMIYLLAPSSLILMICGIRLMIDGWHEEQAHRRQSQTRRHQQP